MEKTQALTIAITVLLAITAVCSVYSAVQQHSNGSMSSSEIDEIKEKVKEANTYGGSIYYNGISVEKASNNSFSTDDHNVIIKYSSSAYYIPFSSVSAIRVVNH